MKTIALVDFAMTGHHLSFLRSFCKILLEQGHKVICIVPEPELVRQWLADQVPGKIENFKSSVYNYHSPDLRVKGHFADTAKAYHRWIFEGRMLKRVERELNESIDLVFYAWVDSQLGAYIPQFVLDRIFPYKWSGLYFHPYHLRREKKYLTQKAVWRDLDAAFLANNCLGVTVHDIGIIDGFTHRIEKPVIHFPETADGTLPDANNQVAKTIREKAGNRIVVGMIGCEKHKGTITMIRMLKKADPSKYFFAFLGIIPKHTYTANEWNEVQEFIRSEPENCFFHFESIPEGAAYNAVFCSFDIPFLVYDDFVSSSNRLTKAAIFERLVLASDNYCVGEDVKKFNLGAAVRPKDADAALEGLEKLAEKISRGCYPRKEWAAYRILNSDEMLYDRFIEVTNLLTFNKN